MNQFLYFCSPLSAFTLTSVRVGSKRSITVSSAQKEESEEKVSVLNQDLKQNETLCLQIKRNLKELRELNNKNSADLEDNQNLKSNIKNYNAELVNFAQQIYSCGQELYANLNLHEIEWDKIEEMLIKNEDKFLEKLNFYKAEDEKLKAELKEITQQETKEKEKKELEIRTLNAEYEELVNELYSTDVEIGNYEECIKEGEELDQLEMEYREGITRMEENIATINVEINTISQLLEDMDRSRQIATTDSEERIAYLDKQITEVRNEIITASKILAENKFGITELNSKITNIEGDNRKKEDDYNKYDKDLHTIEIYMSRTKENMQNEIDCCEKSIFEYEELFKIQNELNEKLKKEITTFKVKIEVEDAENNKIIMDVTSFEEKGAKVDLKGELDTKKNELKQLKATRQDLKGQYSKKYLEIQNEMKEIQAEIESIEIKNKNLQNAIDGVVLEINQMKNNEEERIKEKQNNAKKSKGLDTQIQNLTFEMARAKAEAIKNKQTTADSKIMASPKHFIVPSASKEKKMKVRHWDSDSSIEGENRRFSEVAKQKIKLRRKPK